MKKIKKNCCMFLFLLFIAFIVAGVMFDNYLSIMKDQYRGHIHILSRYFDDLERQGYEVDDSQVADQEKLSEVTEPEILIWRVRNPGESEWTEYEWELSPITEETLRILRERGIPTNEWWKSGVIDTWSFDYPGFSGIRSILLPANEAALEVHRNLGLRLPPEFHLPPYNDSASPVNQ